MNIKIITAVVCLTAIAVSLFIRNLVTIPERDLPVLGTVQSFALQDASGSEFNSAKLQGSVWVANFFFTSCKGICPTIMGEIAQIQKIFRDTDVVSFVSISVDPERDTPAVLLEYKNRFPAANHNWHYLTGSRSAIATVSEQAFQLAAGEVPDAHSQRIVLIDMSGAIRGYYNGLEPGVSVKVIRDIKSLLNAGSRR